LAGKNPAHDSGCQQKSIVPQGAQQKKCAHPQCGFETTGYDYCCLHCCNNHWAGKSPVHGSGCAQKQAQCSVTVATKCANTKCSYKPSPGVDFCCRTCYNHHSGAITGGPFHGSGCNRESCITSVPTQTSHETNCTNLRTGRPLYNPQTTFCFYENDKPGYWMTNFYAASITIGGVRYPTTEHYFQSQGFLPHQPLIAEQIRTAQSPREAFQLARKNNHLKRNDWHNGYKDTVMLDALIAKFTQHTDLQKLLLQTGDKTLVEHTTNDNYWGDNGDGTGKNQLGNFLMLVRKQFVKAG